MERDHIIFVSVSHPVYVMILFFVYNAPFLINSAFDLLSITRLSDKQLRSWIVFPRSFHVLPLGWWSRSAKPLAALCLQEKVGPLYAYTEQSGQALPEKRAREMYSCSGPTFSWKHRVAALLDAQLYIATWLPNYENFIVLNKRKIIS